MTVALFDIVEMTMGWITNPAPGAEHGPCKKKCKHLDCAEQREWAAKPCSYCNEPIGYDAKFYTDGVGGERKFSHALCAWKSRDEKTKTAVGAATALGLW